MWTLIVSCALTCCGGGADSDTPAPSEPLVAEIKQGLQTGSLIFSQGDCLAVKVFSQSSFTHVGGVVVKDGEFFVYDSMNGPGVRKTLLVEYVRLQTPSSVYILHPTVQFTEEKRAAFESHLESQLGRKYAVKHHLTGQRCEGIHCSEYMTDALMAAEMISAKQPAKVSPGSLLEGLTKTKSYVEGNHTELRSPDPAPIAEEQTWYLQAWHSTSVCCSKSATQMRRWILCR